MTRLEGVSSKKSLHLFDLRAITSKPFFHIAETVELPVISVNLFAILSK